MTPKMTLDRELNTDSIVVTQVTDPAWQAVLKSTIENQYQKYTRSPIAGRLLDNWEPELENFRQIMGTDLLKQGGLPERQA